jgi:putative heme-binding domain-containing protein
MTAKVRKQIAAAAAGMLILGSSLVCAQQPAAPKPLDILMQTLARIENPEAQANILRGINATLKGRHDATVPAAWEALYAKLKTSPNEEVRKQAQALAVTFGGESAMAEMRHTLGDRNAAPEARQAALDSLVAAKDAAAVPLLLELLKEPSPLREPTLRGLAGFDDAKIPVAVLAGFPNFNGAEKRDALNSLLSRPSSARAVLAAIDAKQMARTEITAPLVRQLQNIKDPEIEKWVQTNWGVVRTSSEEKQKIIAKFKEFLGTDAILRADAKHGRQLFSQTCAVCHTLFGEGGKIGPELPGSFEDVDYLLLNIIDPNAIIGKDYQQTFITTKSGQFLAGIIASEDAREVVLKTLGDPVTVPRAEIKEMKTSDQSMMPEGLLLALDEQSVRDLFLYLRQRQQVPLPAPK